MYKWNSNKSIIGILAISYWVNYSVVIIFFYSFNYSGVPKKHATRLLILGNFPSNTPLLGATCLLYFGKISYQHVHSEQHVYWNSETRNIERTETLTTTKFHSSMLLSEFHNERLSEIKSIIPIPTRLFGLHVY